MKRSAVILLVDVVSFISFVFLASTGVLLHYLLPPGSGKWSSVWGLNRHEWGDIHFTISVLFFCVLLLHLILHWRVLLNIVRGRSREGSLLRLALGVVGLLVVSLLVFSLMISPTNVENSSDRGGWRHKQNMNKWQLPDNRVQLAPLGGRT